MCVLTESILYSYRLTAAAHQYIVSPNQLKMLRFNESSFTLGCVSLDAFYSEEQIGRVVTSFYLALPCYQWERFQSDPRSFGAVIHCMAHWLKPTGAHEEILLMRTFREMNAQYGNYFYWLIPKKNQEWCTGRRAGRQAGNAVQLKFEDRRTAAQWKEQKRSEINLRGGGKKKSLLSSH